MTIIFYKCQCSKKLVEFIPERGKQTKVCVLAIVDKVSIRDLD